MTRSECSDHSCPGVARDPLYDIVADLSTKLLEARTENTRLRYDNDFLRSNVRDLETRNRELVLARVQMSFTERLEDRTMVFRLAVDNAALMYARDPRQIIYGAFERISGELAHFFAMKGEPLGKA